MQKLNYIDALRGIAIISVLFFHCGEFGNNTALPAILKNVHFHGAMGVQLFYLVSAFTLFLSCDQRFEKEKHAGFNFFIRRFFRIAPMYYLMVVYYLFQSTIPSEPYLVHSSHVTVGNVLSNFFFLHGLSPYWINSIVQGGWSISIEMCFYLLVPFLFLKIKNTRQAFNFFLFTLLFRFVVVFFLNRFAGYYPLNLWNNFMYFFFPNQLPVFALGIFLYYVVKENYSTTASPKTILFFSLLVMVQFAAGYTFIPPVILWAAALCLFVIALSRWPATFFVNAVTRYIGKISFSVYLVHFAVIFWLSKFNFIDYLSVANKYDATLNYAIRFLMVGSLSVLVSTITYRLIESPFQNIGKMIINRFSKKDVAIV